MADFLTEQKSAAAKFMDEHERLENELVQAKAMIAEQANNITVNEGMIAMQKEHISALTNDRNRYLRYSVELSAQLQFIVAGAARALKIAQSVKMTLDQESGANIADVSGADQAELEDIMKRLDANQMTINDGKIAKKTAEMPPNAMFTGPG